MSNAERPIPAVTIESLVARTQAIGVEVLGSFEELKLLAVALESSVGPSLPEGTSLAESFVGAIAETIEQELSPAQLDPLEDAVQLLASEDINDRTLLLEDLWFTTKHQASYAKRIWETCEATAQSLEGLLQQSPRVQAGRAPSIDNGSAKEVAQAIGPIEGSLSTARSIALHCMMLQEAAAEASVQALSALTQLRWTSTQAAIGDERLELLWKAIVEGHLQLDALEEVGLEAEEEGVLLSFVEETSAYLSQELMRARQAKTQEQPEADDDEDDDVSIIPPRFCLKLAYPDPVHVGDIIEFRMVARNDHLVPVVLDTIDIEHTFLNGFVIEAISPPPAEQRDETDELTLAYDAPVPAAGAADIVLRLRAVREGNFAGEIRVWTDEIEDTVGMPNIDVIGTVQ